MRYFVPELVKCPKYGPNCNIGQKMDRNYKLSPSAWVISLLNIQRIFSIELIFILSHKYICLLPLTFFIKFRHENFSNKLQIKKKGFPLFFFQWEVGWKGNVRMIIFDEQRANEGFPWFPNIGIKIMLTNNSLAYLPCFFYYLLTKSFAQ